MKKNNLLQYEPIKGSEFYNFELFNPLSARFSLILESVIRGQSVTQGSMSMSKLMTILPIFCWRSKISVLFILGQNSTLSIFENIILSFSFIIFLIGWFYFHRYRMILFIWWTIIRYLINLTQNYLSFRASSFLNWIILHFLLFLAIPYNIRLMTNSVFLWKDNIELMMHNNFNRMILCSTIFNLSNYNSNPWYCTALPYWISMYNISWQILGYLFLEKIIEF